MDLWPGWVIAALVAAVVLAASFAILRLSYLGIHPADGREHDAVELARGTLDEEAAAHVLLTCSPLAFADLSAHLDAVAPAMKTCLSQADLVVFDVETTGMNRLTDRVVALGAVRVRGGQLRTDGVFYSLVDPRIPIPRLTTRIHGITDLDVVGQPSIEEVVPAFRVFVGAAVPVAHVADFDLAFLMPALRQAHLPPLQRVLDTAGLAAALYPSWSDVALETLAVRLGVPIHARHTAVGDSVATARIVIRLIRSLTARGVLTLNQALDLQGGDPALHA